MAREWFFCFTASLWSAFVVRYKKCNTVITLAFYYNKCWQKKADKVSFSSELSNHTDDGKYAQRALHVLHSTLLSASIIPAKSKVFSGCFPGA